MNRSRIEDAVFRDNDDLEVASLAGLAEVFDAPRSRTLVECVAGKNAVSADGIGCQLDAAPRGNAS